MTASEKAKKTFIDGCIQHIRDIYSGLKDKRIYFFGTGELGKFLCRVLVAYSCVAKKNIKAFINDDESEPDIYGIPVRPFDQCDFSGDDYCVVVAAIESGAILEKLRRQNIRCFADTPSGWYNISGPMLWAFSDMPDEMHPSNMLAKIGHFHELGLPLREMEEFFKDEQSLAVLRNRVELYTTGLFELLYIGCPVTTQEYFDPGVLDIGSNEVYVDCGAYTGDTVREFMHAVKGKYNKIVAFEPDSKNFAAMEHNLEGLANVELVEAATGSSSGMVLFNEGHALVSAIDTETGTKNVPIVRLDDYFKEPVSLVKMDIEGAELDTLRGMERIFREHHPKLAVCAYHKVEDLYTLPKFIKSVVPEYRLKLRQHRPCLYGTVLYAEE